MTELKTNVSEPMDDLSKFSITCSATSNTIDDDIYHFGFHIIDDFLNQKHYQILRTQIKTMYSEGHFKPAKIGRASDEKRYPFIRGDQLCWLDPNANDDALLAFYAAIDRIKTTLNQSLFLGLDDFESHFAIYQSGQFYKKHIDQFKTTQDRRISCVYYLNDDWQLNDGGELTLYDQDDHTLASVLPLGNRLICFNSELPHEVLVTHQTRYSIAGWLKVRQVIRY